MAITVDTSFITADGGTLGVAPPTLGDLKAEIMGDLDRPDLEAQVLRAIKQAVRFFQRERFAFNDGVVEVSTVAGQALYASDDLSGFYALDSATLVVGGQPWDLHLASMADLERVDRPGQAGQPTWLAKWAEGIRLFPVPDTIYAIRLTGHVRIPMPETDFISNPWTNEAGDLIAAYAKRWLALHVLKDPQLKAAMDVSVGEASTSLKGLATTMGGTGCVQSYGL